MPPADNTKWIGPKGLPSRLKRIGERDKIFSDDTLELLIHHTHYLLDNHYNELKNYEYAFLLDMKEHFRFFDYNSKPTLKQAAWIELLYAKYIGHGS